ncbi:MAG: hypothetical protein MRZ79_26950 [Bacteroidia bacterium]|nr:hypothetical protein [Bacteroidia bacterium]
MKNSKNDLHELVKNIGYLEEVLSFSTFKRYDSIEFTSEASLSLNGELTLSGEGIGETKTKAEIAACQQILHTIKRDYKHLLIDWEQVKKEAQIGDVLVKLNAYLSPELRTAEEKSLWLQEIESDKNFAELFNSLKEEGDEAVAFFGSNLGAKKKATWIEALVWKKYGEQILSPNSAHAFEDMMQFLKEG